MSKSKLASCTIQIFWMSLELSTILINIGTAYNCFGVTSSQNLYLTLLSFPLLGFSTMQKCLGGRSQSHL